MNHSGQRIIAEGEWTVGGLAPELERGFTLGEAAKGGSIPLILEEMTEEARGGIMSFLGKHLHLNGEETVIEMTMDEILKNTVDHGNDRKPYLEGRIVCRIEETQGTVRLVIDAFDQGDVFQLSSVPDCSSPDHLADLSGRGIKMIREFGEFTIHDPERVDSSDKRVRFTRPVVRNHAGGLELAPRRRGTAAQTQAAGGEGIRSQVLL